MLHLLLPVIALFACPDCNATPLAAIQPELDIEQTLTLIKPDALSHEQEILSFYEDTSLKILAKKKMQLSPEQAQSFYAHLKDKPFYKDLVAYISSGPIEAILLEGEDAVAVNRAIIGSTDPHKASPGTIRSEFGTDVQHNAVHGSDTPENALKEIAYFFPGE